MRRLVSSRSWPALAFVVAALAGCCPAAPPPPSAGTPGAAPTRPQTTPTLAEPHRAAIAELTQPSPRAASTLAAARDRALAGIELGAIPAEPRPGAPGALLVDLDPARIPISTSQIARLVVYGNPAQGARGKMARMHTRLLKRAPSVTLGADGVARLRFESLRPVPAASVYYGATVPSDIFGLPRLRKQATGLSGDERQGYELPFEVHKLLGARYDLAGARHSGRGLVGWRLEALDVAGGSSRVVDGWLAFRCEPTPCGADARFVQLPTMDLGPVVDRVTPSGAVISWTTDGATAGAVILHDADGPLRTVRSTATGTRHEVRLGELSPDTRYRYYALAVDRRGEWVLSRGATFRTAPPPGPSAEPLSFVVFSDSRSGHGSGDDRHAGTNKRVLEGLLWRALLERPRFIACIGDLVDGATTEPGSYRWELESWLRITTPMGAYVPIYEAMGNHEALYDMWEVGWVVDRQSPPNAESIFADLFVNPDNGPAPAHADAPPYRENVYSFDVGPVHLAVVNTNYWYRSHHHRPDHPAGQGGHREGWLTDEQLDWLDQDLAAAGRRGQRHLFVATHEPGFPNGGHVRDGMYWHGRWPDILAQRDRLYRIMSQRGVTVIFNGDEHNYSRTLVDAELVAGMQRPVWQIISGAAGAPFYAQDHSVPWVDHVTRFDARQHFVAVHVAGDVARIEAIGLTGDVVDRFEVKAPPYSPSTTPSRRGSAPPR